MRKLNVLFVLLLTCFVIVGCSKNSSTTMDNSGSENRGMTTKGNENTEGNEGKSQNEVTMSDYFLPDGSKAHYLGEGNEFAELDVEVAQPHKNYVIIHENNGGTMIRYIYKITNNKIEILDKGMVDYKDEFPSLDELDAMNPTGIYLQQPIEVGTTFDNWTIVQTDVSVETPYKKFDKAFVIEEKGEDFTNRKYFVEGFGEVKRESIMDLEDGEHIVTSTLKAVDQ
ncbi:hypothetical protein ACFPRA_01590 [Sporosarcina soli]|uniref:Lipoprotein n=1 Tax=Sporosarcina soli TaxID=334736 RepID=A0ABW0TGQ4_9BACL